MAEEEKVAAPEAKKKSKLVPLLLIGAGVILMGGGGFVAMKYFKGSKPATGGEAKKEPEGPTSKVKSMMSLDAFLVNLADVEATRFVKVTFRLGLDDPKAGEEYTSDPVVLAAARDKIISILSTKTAEDILSPEGKDKLRNEIRDQVNPLLAGGKIVEVFILDFVVQL
jgi:flagellar FliL protein